MRQYRSKKERKDLKENVDYLIESKGLTHIQIANRLGIKLSLVHSLRMSPERRQAAREHRKRRSTDADHVLFKKVWSFKNRETAEGKKVPDFTLAEVFAKFGPSPICYLTGRPINLNDGGSYHLDHVIPIAKNGSNELNNMQFCCQKANLMKGDWSLEDYIEICREVVAHADKMGHPNVANPNPSDRLTWHGFNFESRQRA